MTTSKQDLAYIAGLFDADGCFSVGTSARGRWIPRSLLTNGDLAILHWVKDALGFGCVYESKPKHPRPNWMPVHRFQACSGAGRLCAYLLLPYVRIKARRAELIAFFPTIDKRMVRNAPAKEAVRKMRDPMVEEIRALNVRGRAKDLDRITKLQRVSAVPPGSGIEWVARGYTHLTVAGPKRHKVAGVAILGPNANDPAIPTAMR